MQFNANILTEPAEVTAVSLVWDIIHENMRRLHTDVRFVDSLLSGEQPHQFEGVLSTRKSYENPVPILQ